jgi:hypothetical protein
LDAKVAPMLPCDPAARKAIQTVNSASDARNHSLLTYLNLRAAQAADETQGARRILQAAEGRAQEAADERNDAVLERGAIDTQNASLSASVNSRPGLSPARDSLVQIGANATRRATLADQNAGARDRGVIALRELLAAQQAREAALKREVDAFQAEAARWNTYYSVRLTRAQAECAATGVGAAPPSRPAAKGKKK